MAMTNKKIRGIYLSTRPTTEVNGTKKDATDVGTKVLYDVVDLDHLKSHENEGK